MFSVGVSPLYQKPLWQTCNMTSFGYSWNIKHCDPDILLCLIISLKNYFRDGWNVFDFIIVLGSLLDFALTVSLVSKTDLMKRRG